jgi:hypothetical protein
VHHAIIAADTSEHFRLFAVNNPVGEAIGILTYMILPVIIGSLIGRGMIYLWMRKSGWRSQAFSPWAASTVIGVFSFVFMYGTLIFSAGGIHTLGAALFTLFYIVFLCAPIIVLLGLGVRNYIVGLVRERPSMPNWSVCLISVTSLIAEYFWLGYALRS